MFRRRTTAASSRIMGNVRQQDPEMTHRHASESASNRNRSNGVRSVLAILITCAPFAALGAATVNPIAEWCDTGNVPGLYESAQAVCTARQAYIGYPTLIYFPDPAAPSYAPYGSCSYWSESYHYWQSIGSASWGLVCPLGFQPVNFAETPGHCLQVVGTGYIGVWANPNGNMV